MLPWHDISNRSNRNDKKIELKIFILEFFKRIVIPEFSFLGRWLTTWTLPGQIHGWFGLICLVDITISFEILFHEDNRNNDFLIVFRSKNFFSSIFFSSKLHILDLFFQKSISEGDER